MTTTTNQRREAAKPTFHAYSVTGEGRNTFWTRIGVAFTHEDGKGFNIPLHCLPVNGRIVLRLPDTDPTSDEKSR